MPTYRQFNKTINILAGSFNGISFSGCEKDINDPTKKTINPTFSKREAGFLILRIRSFCAPVSMSDEKGWFRFTWLPGNEGVE